MTKEYNPLDISNFVVSLNIEHRELVQKYNDAHHNIIESHCPIKVLSTRNGTLLFVEKTDIKRDLIQNYIQLQHQYKEILLEQAIEQDKALTIGDRSTLEPCWTTPAGRVSVLDEPPTLPITIVRSRTQNAYRGGRISPHEAVEMIKDRIIKAEHAIENSINNHQHSRVKVTKDKLQSLNESLVFLHRCIHLYGTDELVIRMNSGQATKVYFSNGNDAWVDSPARLMFAYVEPGVKFEQPKTRDKGSSLVLIGQSGGISIFTDKP